MSTRTGGNADIGVYDVYDAHVVHTFTIPGASARAGVMAISHDGRTLFVNDDDGRKVHALDAETGAWLREFPWPGSNNGLAYMRPSAHPLLILWRRSVFDADTAVLHTTTHGAGWYGGWLSMDGDPSDTFLYTQAKGLSPSDIGQFLVGYSALGADTVSLRLTNGSSVGSNGQDICVSHDGLRLYPTNGAPYEFPEISTVSFMITRHLEGTAYPSNSLCAWNGLFFGGANAYYDPYNVWVYRPDGSQVAKLNMHPGSYISNLLQDTLALSGDGTRLIGSTRVSIVRLPDCADALKSRLVEQSAPRPHGGRP
jgi:hypothetical protein